MEKARCRGMYSDASELSSYINEEIVAGISAEERAKLEEEYDGLKFAFDGMRLKL